jgi:hypothetical protein
MQSEMPAAESACADFPAEQASDAWRYQLAAAEAGHFESITRFASGANLDFENPLADLDGLYAYKSYAPALLQRAAAGGFPRAYLQLGFMHLRPYRGLQQLPKDPVQAIAYWTALAEVSTPEYRSYLEREIQDVIVKERLQPEQVEKARTSAKQLAQPLRDAHAANADFSKGILGEDDFGRHCAPPT